MILQHRCIGYFAWAEQIPGTKLFFNVLMALSDAFRICICGGNSCKLQCLARIYFCNDCDASLSKICNLGRIPLAIS